MDAIGIITLTIVLLNLFVTYQGFKDPVFFSRYSFHVDPILIDKQYFRLITSGFLHNGWMHFIFNMTSLYVFSEGLEAHLGSLNYLVIYFISLIGGDLFALYIHKNNGDYKAVGASGAVCGVIFASIALFPKMELGFPGIDFFIPAWAYGILFVLFCMYGIRSRAGNIGHEAHFGGALIGLITAVALRPEALTHNYLTILLIVVPSVSFIFLVLKRPEFLLLNGSSLFKSAPKYQTKDELFYEQKRTKQEELDRLLEKIHQKGIQSLTKKERETLEELSNKINT